MAENIRRIFTIPESHDDMCKMDMGWVYNLRVVGNVDKSNMEQVMKQCGDPRLVCSGA